MTQISRSKKRPGWLERYLECNRKASRPSVQLFFRISRPFRAHGSGVEWRQ